MGMFQLAGKIFEISRFESLCRYYLEIQVSQSISECENRKRMH